MAKCKASEAQPGNYEFFRVNIMDIESDEHGTLALGTLRGRNAASEKFRAFRGPLNAPIKRMVLSENRTSVRTYTGPTWWTFPYEPYRVLTPPLYERPT